MKPGGGSANFALLACLALAGCSVAYGDLSIIPGLAPSDEVQTATISRIGVNLDAKQMAVNVGYERVQQTRVPGYDSGTYVPPVRSEVAVDANTGAKVGESLEVGNAPASPGLLGTLFGAK